VAPQNISESHETRSEKEQRSEHDCIFCRIAARAVDAKIVFEDNASMAFLDARPLFPGHCLLIPKAHYDTMADLPKDLLGRLFSNAQDLAAVVKSGMQAEGTFVAANNTVSQSVPHFHIHVVPRRRKDGLRGFFWPRHAYSSEDEMNAVRDILCSQMKHYMGNR
jgi:histidine triad (HIT) family protein